MTYRVVPTSVFIEMSFIVSVSTDLAILGCPLGIWRFCHVIFEFLLALKHSKLACNFEVCIHKYGDTMN